MNASHPTTTTGPPTPLDTVPASRTPEAEMAAATPSAARQFFAVDAAMREER